ncbi:MAG TPA: D-alanine--D-alanine ligase [Candidatus Stackebrandtia faecavium]|nr:D-alanine--D-alanine ligase [Candidatus Stackebrandtia faecavium]
MTNIRVAVILGGRSVEHAVSTASGAGVLSALQNLPFEAVPIGITQDGRWAMLGHEASKQSIGADSMPQISADAGDRVVPSADPTPAPTVDAADGMRFALSDVDVAFPVLHGSWGEDGTVQGLLEMAGVPYVGSGVLSSAVCMDKVFTKRLLANAGIPIGPYEVVRAGEELTQGQMDRLGLPVFVKPSRSGSSLGVTRVTAWSQLPKALEVAHDIDPKALVESAFTGVREIECAVLGGADGAAPETSGPLEVLEVGEEGWFDFDSKYLGSDQPYDLAPDLPEGVNERIRELSAQVFTLLDCSDLARIDLFLAPDGEVYVNEINTMPGLTPKSGVPLAWQAAGLDYDSLIARLVNGALARGTGLR